MILFTGTREYTGCDFTGYLNRFKNYFDWNYVDAFSATESVFHLLNLVIYKNGLDFMWLNVAASLIVFLGIYKFSIRREYPVRYLALMFPIMIVQLAMSGIRQAIAVGLLLLAFNAFNDGKRLLMAALILLAAQFHTSAIVFLPLVFVIGRNPSIKMLIAATLLATPVAIYLAGERLELYQARYIEEEVESFGAIFRVALLLITAVFFEFYRERYRQFFPIDFPLMRIMSLASFAVVGVFFISTLAAHRLGYYIAPIQLLMLMRLPHVMSPVKRNGLYEAAPYLVYGAYVMVWFTLSRHAQLCYTPYDSYLF